jgi:hypothetical protein
MLAKPLQTAVPPGQLRLMLLAYGLSNPYRVVGLDEIANWIGHPDRPQVRHALEALAYEGLVTRFSGRYCFNRAIPTELRILAEQSFTPSGTVRVPRSA